MIKKPFKTLLYLAIFLILAQFAYALNIVELSPGYYPNTSRGRPLSSADIYVGKPDLDPEIVANQKTLSVQQEDGTIVAVSQPIHTNAGGVPVYSGSPVVLLVEGDYSLKVLDSNGSQVYYVPSTAYEKYLVTGNYYYPDYSEADQGVVGGGETVTDILAEVGATENATIYFSHNSGGNTTTYTFTTDTTITDNFNIIIEEGAILGGAGTLTVNGLIEAGSYRIFSSAGTVNISGNGDIWVDWFGALKDKACLSSMMAMLGSTNNYNVKVSPQEWSIDDNVTLTDNFELEVPKGATFVLTAAKTFTIQSSLKAGLYQIFSGAGTVDLDNAVINEIYPQWWGAVGDGTTDCTAAIQAAIDSLDSTHGGIVAIPPGKYYISSAIAFTSENIKIIGLGKSGNTHYQTAGVELVSDQAINIIDFGDGTLIRKGPAFENLTFQDISGSNDQVTAGIYNDGAQGMRIVGCAFSDITAGKGVYLDGSTRTVVDAVIEDIYTWNCKWGVYIEKATLIKVDGGHYVGNDIADSIGIYLTNNSSGNYLLNVLFDDCDTGIKLDGNTLYSSIIGARFEDCNDIGIHIDESGKNFFSHCLFVGGGFGAGGAVPFQIDDDANNIDNYIIMPHFAAALSTNITNNSTMRTHILDAHGYQSTPIELPGNDATPSVVTWGCIFKTNNGVATTITDLDDMQIGQKIVLIIDDSNTTVDFTATNLKGNQGADWSPDKYDWMECFYDGTYKYCSVHDTTS